MGELHDLLGKLRQFVDMVAGDKRPSRDWAIELRGFIDSIPERALAERAGGVKVKKLEWESNAPYHAWAHAAFGDYYVRKGTIDFHPDEWTYTFNREETRLWYPSLNAAQAAVQADHERRVLSDLEPAAPEGRAATFTYKNWRGEVSERTIVPKRVWFGATEWHPEPQWLLTAFDVEKQADRDFALKDFGLASPTPPVPEVTEAMVERMIDAFSGEGPYTITELDDLRIRMRDALTAALSKTGDAR